MSATTQAASHSDPLTEALFAIDRSLTDIAPVSPVEALRRLAKVQRGMARATVSALTKRRRWLRAMREAGRPGMAVFYRELSPERAARALAYARSCRLRAAQALAEARKIEASGRRAA